MFLQAALKIAITEFRNSDLDFEFYTIFRFSISLVDAFFAAPKFVPVNSLIFRFSHIEYTLTTLGAYPKSNNAFLIDMKINTCTNSST